MTDQLVLLHGVGLDHRMWDRCAPELARDNPVLAPDLPGHGAGGAVEPDAELDDLAAAVARRLSGPAHLVGFSLGALVAQCLAVRHPELVRSLVLVSSVAARSPEQSAAVGDRLRGVAQDFAGTAEAAVQRWMSPDWQAREPELADRLRTTLLGNDLDDYLACYRIFATADRELAPLLPGITAPTLAITGAEDPGSTPAMTEHLAATIPEAHAVVVPGARHLLPLERPDRLVAEIRTHLTRTTVER
ncbi:MULTISPECIES: alpha/beta fold hydrolase [unclassified Saccharopolyspora]|uniref:alpha/beta fold hydrolase n=1 Tax=unclassified Saccharopolyspora TaxID=2646250 RepID=UPI001CD3BD1F|nr:MULTISPECIES: alpha/beta fold hydrolase [unclassified Saccharopolyspora]MCA1226460.1 alpha/beta fold hydrolase [Saccharopolyspora sp. 6M]MCA1283087.1 alpha/beta fold hydrolase [Saccharopolyspora sp. 7B]